MIRLLDCTLRDGGYVNNWEFGQSIIAKIVDHILLSGVELIELGYLSTKDAGLIGVARYDSLQDVRRAYSSVKNDCQEYAVMINLGEYPAELIPQMQDGDPIIRLAFHKKDVDKAINYATILQNHGFRYFLQPMGVLNYSDEEFVALIHKANAMSPEAFYIVDSFGVIELKDFRRLLFLADNNLRKGIQLGYHAHNNLQQAYSNAKYMIEQGLDHDLIIDASIFGMGRGAGNLNIELFAEHLNRTRQKGYNIEPILEAFDECLKPIFARQFWGYSLTYYLSSIHNCHPNYASYFAEKNTLSVKSMHELLGTISEDDRISFSKEKATIYYNNFQENWIDDHEDLNVLKNYIVGRPILILAPGSSISRYSNKINQFISVNQPVVIGVGQSSDIYKYDFLFVNNEKRLVDKPSNVGRFIKTSNLHKVLRDTIQVNYSSYVCSNPTISDNPTLMLINLLIIIGVHEVFIAGFDGYCANPENNYFAHHLSLGSSLATKIEKNELISSQVKELRRSLNLVFLTDSIYLHKNEYQTVYDL